MPGIDRYRRPTLLVDIDGVLADFCLPFTTLARDLLVNPQKPWTTFEQLHWKFDFPVDRLWAYVSDHPDWWLTLPSLLDKRDRAWLALWVAEHDGFVWFVSNRKEPDSWTLSQDGPVYGSTWAWIRQHVPLPSTSWDLMLTPDKAAFAQEQGRRGCRILAAVDDKPENISALRAAGVPVARRYWKYNQYTPADAWVDSLAGFVDWAETLSYR